MTSDSSGATASSTKGESKRYDHAAVEARWQRYWDEHETFRSVRSADRSRPKRYILDMFPYPSGKGLHVGHPEGYTATDILSRYYRARGYDVLHPMGWDAFGLPAEQHAVKTGTHPADTTKQNIATFKRQLKSLGFSYDWAREIDTTDPRYVRWTQWIFLQLFRLKLAYQDDKVSVNWCPALGTVLANEEIIDGKSEIGGHPVERVRLRQWMMRITAYADRLLDDLALVDWPKGTLAMQREWIGRSEGAEIRFAVEGRENTSFDVFTTRADTLMGCTYAVLAPEHPLVAEIASDTCKASVLEYVAQAVRKSDRDRASDTKQKTGVPTGAVAVHPITGASIPIWVADYVIGGYGTGAVMAVPAHDERDFSFAKAFGLPIVQVVKPIAGEANTGRAYVEEGVLVNSGPFDGLASSEAKAVIVERLAGAGRGKARVTYKLRDWVFSRQRYWGEPIPIYFPVEVADGLADPRRGDPHTIRYDQAIAVEESELPLRLPDLTDFRPGEDPSGPLARAVEWRYFQKDGRWFARETNTMPQWAGSCWYFLRFVDPTSDDAPFGAAAYEDWMPVDTYVGGAEHAVLHLLYARFWHKVLFDLKLVKHPEPFIKLVHQGMILGEVEYTTYRDSDGQPVDIGDVDEDGDMGPAHKRTAALLTLVKLSEADVQKSGASFVLKAQPAVRVSAMAHKMSKARGNVVNPDDIVRDHGADALRLYEMFMGPLDAVKPWQTGQIQGVVRFCDKVFALATKPLTEAAEMPTKRLLHKTIKKVTSDIDAMSFNTAVSALMVFANHLTDLAAVPREGFEGLLQLLAPFAPHLCEELWLHLGHGESIALAPWPQHDEALSVDDVVEIAIQVNGKVRARVTLPRAASEADARQAALGDDSVKAVVGGKEIKKFVYVPGKIINIVV